MKSLEEQIKDKINSLMNELTDNPEKDRDIKFEIHQLKKILDFRVQQPEK